ncbi:ABC transporter substrate-binding protein [Actinocorallia longicatena]|uniref:ABC transporter substrate-binding protein n=1 Tax=Actinocorallia longicatena TaxID=111803 RepID=A0ABP6QHL5_9ACTN
MRLPSSLRAARIIGALVLSGALISACGGSGDEETPAGPAKITLGFSAWPGWFPWQIAQEKGLFAKNGVTVDLKYFDSYTDSLQALSTGAIDANSQTLNDTLASVSGGAKQTIVLVNDNSTGNDQIIARPGIASLADLKGKTVAAEQGTVDHYLLLLALKKAGLTEKDITFKPLPTDAAAAAFASGQVDAVGVFAPFTTTALKLKGSKAIATSKDFPGAIPDHLVVKRDLVEKQGPQVQALVQTWFDTLKWIKENPAEAIGIMAKRADVSQDDYKSYDAGTTIFSLADNIKAFGTGGEPVNLNFQAEQIATFLVDADLADEKPALDGLFEPRFLQGLKP